MLRFNLHISFAVLILMTGAFAQSVDPDRLDELSERAAIEKAKEDAIKKDREIVSGELGRLKQNLTKIAAEANAYEREGRQIELHLTALQSKERRLKSDIYGDRQALIKLLAALQRIESNPPPALAVSPEDAADAARAGRLMSTVSAELKIRSDGLVVKLEDLNRVEVSIRAQQDVLEKTEAKLESRRQSIKSKVNEKSKLEKALSQDQAVVRRRVAALAAEADTLRDLIQQFEQSTRMVTPRLKPKKGAPPPKTARTPRRTSVPAAPLKLPKGIKPFATAKGHITTPVTGRVSKSYTAARKGLTVSTREKAQVVSPYAGRVEFSGPFKNYDNVVILNVGGGYFMLLTGLGEIYVESKEMVAAGEPLGLMPFNTQARPELYIELRKGGQTINPTPWFGTAFARNE